MNPLPFEYASAWLTATPADAATRLSNEAFSTAVRLRLGISHTDDAIKGCGCRLPSSKPADKSFDPRHDLSCIKSKQSDVTYRHDLVKIALNKWLRRMNAASYMEWLYAEGTKLRADIWCTLPTGEDYTVDIAITSATCPSAVEKRSHRQPFAAASAVARSKRTKYRGYLAGSGAEFVPFVSEADGGMIDDAVNFVKQIAEAAAEDNSCGWTQTEAYRHIIGEVAVAIQKGNHRIIRRALSNNRRAGFIVSKEQAGELDDDAQSFYGDDRDLRQQPQREQQSFDEGQRQQQQTDADSEREHKHSESIASTEIVLPSESSHSHKPHPQPDHAQNMDYKEDDHEELSPAFPSPHTARRAATRLESQLLDGGVQIDPNVDSLLQSPSQREALHERGVELPLQPSQSDEDSTDQLAELEITAAAELEAMRERGVVLPFNTTAASGDAAEDGLSSEQPLEFDP